MPKGKRIQKKEPEDVIRVVSIIHIEKNYNNKDGFYFCVNEKVFVRVKNTVVKYAIHLKFFSDVKTNSLVVISNNFDIAKDEFDILWKYRQWYERYF
jgi:hypothetical protein